MTKEDKVVEVLTKYFKTAFDSSHPREFEMVLNVVHAKVRVDRDAQLMITPTIMKKLIKSFPSKLLFPVI